MNNATLQLPPVVLTTSTEVVNDDGSRTVTCRLHPSIIEHRQKNLELLANRKRIDHSKSKMKVSDA